MRKLLVTALAVLASSGCTLSVPQSPDETEPPSSRRAPSPPADGRDTPRDAVGTAASDSLWWPPPPPLPPGPFDVDAPVTGDDDTGSAVSDYKLWPPLTPPRVPLGVADGARAHDDGAHGAAR